MTRTTRGQTALPTYQYRCTECDHEFEEFQSFTDDALTVCPVCGGRLRKVFNAVGVVFKGSGFYRNDSRAAGASSAAASSSANGSGDSGSSDAGTKTSTSGSQSSSDSSSPRRRPARPARRAARPARRSGVQHRRVVDRRLSLWRGPADRPRPTYRRGMTPALDAPTFPAGRRERLRRALRRTVLARRRPLAAACAGVAVLAGLHAARPRRRADRAGAAWRPTTSPRAPSCPPTTWSPAATRRPPPRPGRRAGAVGPHPGRAGPRRRAGHRRPAGRAVPRSRATRDGWCCRSGSPTPTSVALLRVGDRVSLVAADPRRGTASYVAVDVPVARAARPADERRSGGRPAVGAAGGGRRRSRPTSTASRAPRRPTSSAS